MAVRFYVDENVSEQLIRLLTLLGHDAIGTTSAGNKGASDAVQLLFALRGGRIFLTHNVHDFKLIHETLHLWSAEWEMEEAGRHPGILLFPDSGQLTTAHAVHEINRLITAIPDLNNRLFSWISSIGWTETA